MPSSRSGALSAAQEATLRAVGETLLPGAGEADIVGYVTRNLALANPRLFLKFRDLPIEPTVFYRDALNAIDRFATMQHGRPFIALAEPERTGVIAQLSEGDPPGWDGPDANEVYMVLRMDAFDVIYATPAGYERLGVPLRPHIAPDRPW